MECESSSGLQGVPSQLLVAVLVHPPFPAPSPSSWALPPSRGRHCLPGTASPLLYFAVFWPLVCAFWQSGIDLLMVWYTQRAPKWYCWCFDSESMCFLFPYYFWFSNRIMSLCWERSEEAGPGDGKADWETAPHWTWTQAEALFVAMHDVRCGRPPSPVSWDWGVPQRGDLQLVPLTTLFTHILSLRFLQGPRT